jgi:hypothetical protein
MSSNGSLSSGNILLAGDVSPFLGASPSMGAQEFGQTMFIDDNLSAHARRLKARSTSFSESQPLLKRTGSVPSILEFKEYGARSEDQIRTIRFQVVIWYVGKVDVLQGRVPMTFRVTIFWNDTEEDIQNDDSCSAFSQSHVVWSMHGRQQAFQKELPINPIKAVNVPPVSILNVDTFATIGNAEVTMLREDTKLMRWTCMYRATLIQEDWSVEAFPHDRHDITLKLAILAHRGKNRQWDRDVWKLALATNHDAQGSTQVPHGLVVSQVKVPEFHLNKEALQFNVVRMQHGFQGSGGDQCMEIKFSVLRDSGYYDKNIMPLLGLLNLVAVSIVCLEPESFFQRGLLTLNIAFVEIGIRMTTDSHLPSVAYQIKMQRILNEYFCGLLLIVLESIFVYELADHGWSRKSTDAVDWAAAVLFLLHNSFTIVTYYSDARLARRKIKEYK